MSTEKTAKSQPKKLRRANKTKAKRKDSVPKVKVKTRIEQCTEKEKLWLQHLFDPEVRFNATEAYVRAYGASRRVANINGCKLWKKLSPIIAQWLDDEGLSENHLKYKLLTLLNAKETKFFAHEGVVVTEREVEALSIQLDALKTAMKARGMLSEKSTREVDQIDRLIELELEKLAAARQGPPAGATAEADEPDRATT